MVSCRLRRRYLFWLIAASYSLTVAFGTLHHHNSGPLAGDDNCCLCSTLGLDHDPQSDGQHGQHEARPERIPGRRDSARIPAGTTPRIAWCASFLGQASLSPQLVDPEASAALFAEVEPPAPACPATGFRASVAQPGAAADRVNSSPSCST